MIKFTIKDIKRIVGNSNNGFVYKDHNSITGEPEIRIKMSEIDMETRIFTKIRLGKFGISLYHDGKSNNPHDYLVTF